jgi:hypothetical protein
VKRRFDFRLERVRRVRAIEEGVARAERARAEALARAAEASRDQARSVLEESRAWLRSILTGALDARRVLSSQRALDGELSSLRRRVESARTQRVQAERMAGLHRERKSAASALEELRERHRRRHEAGLAAADEAALDEAAQRRAEAQRRGERARSDDAKAEDASSSDRATADPPDPYGLAS